MKIKSLEINYIRGIKELKHSPDGKSMVIYGPNGTGKSAVVDAVDFLLTGEITRLKGDGTEGITLKEHGCHIDFQEKLKETSVKAVVETEGKEITITRSINSAHNLKVEPEAEKGRVEQQLKVADLGQHILSRRQILNFICAKGGDRARKIQDLLNLSRIENIRSSLVSVQTETGRDQKQADSAYTRSENDIKSLLSVDECPTSTIIGKVNELREKLPATEEGTKPAKIEEEALWKGEVKDGIKPLYDVNKKELSVEQIENYVKQLRTLLGEKQDVLDNAQRLNELLDKILKDEKYKKQSSMLALLKASLPLMGEDNICPLCEREWNDGDFKEHLENKKKDIEVNLKEQKEIDELSGKIKIKVDSLKDHYEKLHGAHIKFGITAFTESKEGIIKSCEEWSLALDTPLKTKDEEKWPASALENMFDEKTVEAELLKPLEEEIKKSGSALSTQQKAWDTLTKLEDVLKRFKQDEKDREKKKKAKDRADYLLEHFVQARDKTLEAIYDSIKGKFEEYYRVIHSEDEEKFTSKLTPDGAALHLEVDFYDRGHFPPHALHSEGHQDSMGLCLFFALNEYLTKNIIKVVVLDDTVMSIDKDHRRAICKLLKESFPDRQLIITTHDSTWARQLKTDGVVSKKNMIHFVNWNIDVGPTYELEKDLWDRINEDLEKNDIPAAAARLRRNAECFFEEACDLLGADIPYRGDHQWALGEYATSAISSLKKYLKKAKENYQTDEHKEKLEELKAFDKTLAEVVPRSQVEQWAINAEVHFNKLTDMGKNDFKPVCEAFKGLFELFACAACQQPLALGEHRDGKKTISCGCGKVFWSV